MSWMPNPGTIVRMSDGRIAIVVQFSPLGELDEVMLEDGHCERTPNAQGILQMLTEESDAAEIPPAELLRRLRDFIQERGTQV